MFPLLPPQDHYQLSREFARVTDRRRQGRHLSSLDLHELGGVEDALRPGPVWMALRHAVQRIGQMPAVLRVQRWIEREPDPSTAPTVTTESAVAPRHAELAADTGRTSSGC